MERNQSTYPNIPNDGVRKSRKIISFVIGSVAFIFVLFVALMVWGFVSIVKDIGSVASTEPMAVNESILKSGGSDRVAIIKLHGEITTEDQSLSSSNGASAASIIKQLKQAADDETVKAVVLDIDSPGGTVVGAAKIYDELKVSTKPVVAVYSGDVAASGAVYASMGAKKIISYPDTITGSIGVISEFYDLSDLMTKYGIKENVIKTGQYKDIGSFSRPMTDAERELLSKMELQSYDRFVQVIADSRHLTVDQVKAFADGRVYSGRDAKDLKMVDQLGTLSDGESLAASLANIENPTIVEYSTVEPFSSLFSFLQGSFKGTSDLAVLERFVESRQTGLKYLYNK